MQTGTTSPSARVIEGSGGLAPVRQLIGEIDGRLARAQGIRTFSTDPRCILRYAPVRSSRAFVLSDGAEIRRGDLLIDLHCWNERVPPMPSSGPDLAWAQRTSRRLQQSLELLATAATTDPALKDARACRAKVAFVGQGCSNESVSRIIRRMGFEDVNEGETSVWTRVHDTLENALLTALVWAHNPTALRRDKLARERRPVWASRAGLLARHRSASAQNPNQ